MLPLLLLSSALAADVSDMMAPYRPSVVDTPLEEVLALSAVVVEGRLLEERHDVWLGPTGTYGMLIWRIQVEEELLGHVESGVVDLVVSEEWPPNVEPGDRVMVMGNLRTLYGRTYTAGRSPPLGGFPAYDDLLVPTVYGALYHTFWYQEEEGAPIVLRWSSPFIQQGADWLPYDRRECSELPWAEVVRRVRDGVADCERCLGTTISGAPIEELR